MTTWAIKLRQALGSYAPSCRKRQEDVMRVASIDDLPQPLMGLWRLKFDSLELQMLSSSGWLRPVSSAILGG